MLTSRSSELQKDDVEKYLAPLTQTARAVEEPIARGALAVPVTRPHLEIAQSSVSDRTRLIGIKVAFVYTYEGLPQDNEFKIPFLYDLVRLDKVWRVTSVSVQDQGYLPPWATGPVSKSTTEHFVAIFRPGVNRIDESLRLAESAREKLTKKVTFPLETRYVILFAKNRAEYEAMTARPSPTTAIAQAETSYEVTPTSIKVESRQIVVNLEKLFEEGSATETFQHELGHLALATDTRPFTPAWVGESAAMYLAGTRPVHLWRSGTRQGKYKSINFADLNRATTLGLHDPTGVAATFEYAYSAAAAYYLVDTFGAEKYWEFYRSYATVTAKEFYERLPESRIATENEQAVIQLAVETTNRNLKQIFNLTEAELDTKVRAWLASARA